MIYTVSKKTLLLSILTLLVLSACSKPIIQQPKQKISPKQAPQAIACTQEAKACPDGSYVSRTGPNCEFSICPK